MPLLPLGLILLRRVKNFSLRLLKLVGTGFVQFLVRIKFEGPEPSNRLVYNHDDYKKTTLVSSRGLIAICQHKNSESVSSSPLIDENLTDSLESGDTVYLCTDALPHFLKSFYPKITVPFTLVSGDSDQELSEKFIQEHNLNQLLESDYLRKWYAQNLSACHAKLQPLPIGLDLHTAHQPENNLEAISMLPLEQERLLASIRDSADSFEQRLPFAIADWHLMPFRGNRLEALLRLPRSGVQFTRSRMYRSSLWRVQSRYRFVLSPEGAGRDCHRTWEAMVLGCMPIVKRSPLTDLYKDFPVIIVDRWEDVSRDFLQSIDPSVVKNFDRSKLELRYWKALIEA